MTKFILYALHSFMFIMTIPIVYAQNSPFPNPELLISDDVNIKSIDIQNISGNYQLPYAKLGEQFIISFDDLDSDQKNYYYTVEHYDSNWEKSDIFDNDYIEGYNEGEITDYAYSFNTLKKYTHYSFKFPNRDMKVLVSGNYLLKVYLDDPDEPSFIRRLVIYEDIVNIGAKVDRATVVNKRDFEQQINFTLNHRDINIENPSEEIKVSILQNNTWDNAIYDLKYQYLGNNTLIYNYYDKSNFKGGNYFYHLDTKSIRTAGLYTDFIRLEDIYHTFLYTNVPRNSDPFTTQQDYNGGFVIRSVDGGDTKTEGDYSNIHFSLKTVYPHDNSKIYVYGAFNDWRLEEENRLKYDEQRGVYSTSFLLKQGYYDYKYIVIDNGEFHPDAISGSFYQTENNYTIIVYYKSMDSRFDRVIGFYQLRSENLF
ncbi:MAG: type IX secretion system plug protein domain-containing protein [Bacteroidota bacterium]